MEIINYHEDINIFFNTLDKVSKAKAISLLEMLALKEYQLRMPYSKKITRDIYELRVQSFQNIRIFYTFYQSQIFLLHIINKKTQTLRSKDIKIARNRLRRLQSI